MSGKMSRHVTLILWLGHLVRFNMKDASLVTLLHKTEHKYQGFHSIIGLQYNKHYSGPISCFVLLFSILFPSSVSVIHFHPSSPVIPLKTELAVELLEKGRVRFWLQAEKISANGKVEYVFNDNMISQGEVRRIQKQTHST